MRLRYSRPLTIAILVVGVLLLVLSLATGEVVSIFAGAVLTLLGLLMTLNPLAVIEGGELQRKNPLGMTLKRYPVAGPTDLQLDGKKVVHTATGKTTVSIGFGIDATDAATWRDWIGGGAAQ